jgi:hypothetical protein
MKEKETINSEKSTEILEKILPQFFKFTVWESERLEDGSIQKLYSSVAEKIYWEIFEVLNKK